MTFAPRWEPATGSCSEATPTTSPTGVSAKVPAVDRIRCGSPPTTSTALWSRCSCVTSSSEAVTSSSGG